MVPKALSVREDGQLDDFVSPCIFTRRVLSGGYTRLEISSTPDKIGIVFKVLCDRITFPCKLRYVKKIDASGPRQLDPPESYAAVEVSKSRLQSALESYGELFFHDGRCELWVHGDNADEQVVLDDLGVIYAYPDDFAFREALAEIGWPELPPHKAEMMTNRDYVRVNLQPTLDELEQQFLQHFGLVRWG